MWSSISSLSLGYTAILLCPDAAVADEEEQEAIVASLGDVGEMTEEEEEDVGAAGGGAAAALWKGESLVESSLLYAAPLRLRLNAGEDGEKYCRILSQTAFVHSKLKSHQVHYIHSALLGQHFSYILYNQEGT